jgi:hypothetical protein
MPDLPSVLKAVHDVLTPDGLFSSASMAASSSRVCALRTTTSRSDTSHFCLMASYAL